MKGMTALLWRCQPLATLVQARSAAAIHCSYLHTTAACGKDEQKSPIEDQLYGRPDREPYPSPNASVTQESFAGDKGKSEGADEPAAYPVQNDPAVEEPNPTKTAVAEGRSSGPVEAAKSEFSTQPDYGGLPQHGRGRQQ